MTEGSDRPDDENRTPPAAGPPPGHGGPGGYGPPPGYGAPQPGIVPLRPLDLGDVLGGAFRFVRTQPAVALIPAAVVMLIVGPAQFAVSAAIAPPPGVFPGFVETMNRSLLPSIPIVVVGLVIYPPMLGMQFSALVPAVLGRRMPLGEAWAAARPRLGGVYGVYLVLALVGVVVLGVGYGLALLVGQAGGVTVLVAVLIVLVAFAVWLWILVQAWPAFAAAVVEGRGTRSALERSRSLVRGSWWRFFGIEFVAYLVAVLAAMVVVIPASILGAVVAISSSEEIASTGTLPVSYYLIMGVAVVIVGAVLIPYLLAVVGLLYVDQRIRRERYDLELAAHS